MSSIQTEKKSSANIKGIPLRTIVILPFLLQMFVVIGMTGHWSLRNREIVIDLVGRLQQEVSDRPQTHRQVNSLQVIHSNPTSVAGVEQGTSLDGQKICSSNDLEVHPPGLPIQTLINDFFDLFRFRADQLKELFCVSPAQKREAWYGLETLKSAQNSREGAIYLQQQDNRHIPFPSKLKDSVQKFLEQAIAPFVAKDLYPERSL